MKYLLVISLMFIVSACSSTPKAGSDWAYIMSTGRQDHNSIADHYVNKERIELLDNRVREGLALSVYRRPRLLNNSGERYVASLRVKQVDCKGDGALYNQRTKESSVHSSIPPTTDNLLGYSKSNDDWDSPRENSLGDMVSRFICSQ